MTITTLLRCRADDSPPPPRAAADPGRPRWPPRSPPRRPRPRSARCRSASSARSSTRADRPRSRTRRSTPQMALMASSGVESVRSRSSWADSSPRKGVYNFDALRPRRAAAAPPPPRRARRSCCTRRAGLEQAAQRATTRLHAAQEPGDVRELHEGADQALRAQRDVLGRPRRCRSSRSAAGRSGTSRARRLVLGHAPVGSRLREAAAQGLPGDPQGATAARPWSLGSLAGVASGTPVGAACASSTGPAPSATSTRSRCTPSRTTPLGAADHRPDDRDRQARAARRSQARARRRQADHHHRADLAGGPSARSRSEACSASRRRPRARPRG